MSVDRIELFAAESWPGGRAPAEWWVTHGKPAYPGAPALYWAHASLWVPDIPALTGDDALGALWWSMRGAQTLDRARALAIEAARDLEAERDAILYAIPAEAWRFGHGR